jgi:chemotaxis protein CheC
LRHDELGTDDLDAFQEIVNIGMGTAGAALGSVLGSFVTLSVPRIRIVDSVSLRDVLASSTFASDGVYAVRQAFYDHLEGEVIVLFGGEGCRDLGDLLGHETRLTDAECDELLLEVTNVLVGACMNGVAQQLKTRLRFSAPSILGRHTRVDDIIIDSTPMNAALVINLRFIIQQRSFESQILIMMPRESLATLLVSVAKFIESV